MTSTLTNQGRVFKACLTQTERVSDDITRKIRPLDFMTLDEFGMSCQSYRLSIVPFIANIF